MPKIRDLGISVIPATMRPPEIGYGAACNYSYQASAPQCDGTPDEQCCPTESQSARDKDEDDDDQGNGGNGKNITPDQRRELQQQLRNQIGLQV